MGIRTSTSTRSPGSSTSPPNTAPCGPCRRKCRSRMLPSSWAPPDSGSPMPKSPALDRAAASCNWLTGGLEGVFFLSFGGGAFSFYAHPQPVSWCIHGPVFPLSLCRYYEYIFGDVKKQKMDKSLRAGPSELLELQVWITSPDSECDSYPTVFSDESCESRHFLIDIIFYCTGSAFYLKSSSILYSAAPIEKESLTYFGLFFGITSHPRSLIKV